MKFNNSNESKLSNYFAFNMSGLIKIVSISIFVSLALAQTTEKYFNSDKNNQFFIEPNNKYTWNESIEECKSQKMEILTIETLEKSNEINDLLQKVFSGKKIPKFYIGANDFTEFRKFVWIDGKPFEFTNWEQDEPNNYNKLNERCVNVGFHGTIEWNDIRCDRKLGFICQNPSPETLMEQKTIY